MAAEYVVAIDIGTQSTRAALVDARGRIADVASAPVDLFAPRPGWAEQDPEQWWQTTVASLAAIMARHPAAQVAAVAVGAQMHSLVAVDAAGHPLTARAAIWSDKRCLDQVREFSARADCEPLSRLAGNRPLPAWAGFKMAWLRASVPDTYARAASLLVAKDFVNLRLCGTVATDPSEASGTFLCDAGTGQWSPPLLEALGISRAKLPGIAASSAVIGTIRPAVAQRTGLAAGVPVVAGSGDMMCQLLGAGITVPGRVGLVAGTASIVAAAAGAASPDPRVMNLRSASGSWIHFGISDAAGKSLRWFADQLAGPPGAAAFEELTRQAAQVSAGSDGLLFFPYLLGERTLGSPLSRGSFIGATLGHGRAHFARAVLEGITFEDRRALEAIGPPEATGAAEPAGPTRPAGTAGPAQATGPAAVRCCGGGARSALWNQIRAGIFGRPVQTLNCAEGGILGAALLAGVGAGWYPDAAAGADQLIRAACTWEPDPAETAVYQSAFGDFCAAHDALQELWRRWAGGDGCHDRALRWQAT
ncbi:MAG TPA: FGGY family carbohydrate kinase [Streptosporangiaceae bacterium]|nr:FGGY family carbohydrate kinase [Streptosporangiaceae bacterium]